MRIAVILATAGRPEVVARAVEGLAHQSEPAERLIVVGAAPEDVERVPAEAAGRPVEVAIAGRGLTIQRNHGIEMVKEDVDLIVFFDDDFAPSRFWLAQARRLMMADGSVNAFTGRILADGIHGPGLGWETAEAIVAKEDAAALALLAGGRSLPHANAGDVPSYGCNMGFRMSAIGDQRFDERLKLYGWQEDTDFSARARGTGKRVRFDELWGVHLGVKSGRSPGIKLGYAQVVNVVYLMRKGTMTPGHALPLLARNLVANLVKSLRPEPEVDRKGRLKGNLRGLFDVLTGRAAPERVGTL
ncbi:MAG: glycosyltransferase [Bosea sp.]|jgi:GT2 family glycosyltransferase|nr:glycosyltransferase [Bosea sp. (in: a-proteobacteria)]